MPLYRTQRVNVYHECQRCGVRHPLSRMTWENGLLVCFPNECYDKGKIVGTRDMAVAREVAIWRHEMEPDAKLVNPIARRSDQADVLY